MQTVLYTRTSMAEQTIGHQKTQAEQAGFTIDLVVADEGVSGVATRLADRPEGRRLFDILRAGDTLVVRWVDRLGRNYDDVCSSIRAFMDRGVIIRTVINGFTFDGATKDPVQKAVRDSLIAFMAATAQAQAEATKAAQRAGIDAAKVDAAKGKERVYLGRKPSYDRRQLDTVSELLQSNAGVTDIVDATMLSRQTVYRIKTDPVAAEAALAAWEQRKRA